MAITPVEPNFGPGSTPAPSTAGNGSSLPKEGQDRGNGLETLRLSRLRLSHGGGPPCSTDSADFTKRSSGPTPIKHGVVYALCRADVLAVSLRFHGLGGPSALVRHPSGEGT